MPGIEAILFDNDGVLVHTEQHWFEANRSVLHSMGVEYGTRDFIQHTFDEGWGSGGWLTRKGFSPEFIEEFSARRDRIFAEKISRTDVTEPSAPGVLAELRKSLRLGVVTNTAEHFFATLHARNTILDSVEVRVLRADYAQAKPAPDAYLAGLEKLNLPAGRILAVEDSPRGIRSAQAAGLKVAGIVNPAFPELDIGQADYRLEDLTDLVRLVERL